MKVWIEYYKEGPAAFCTSTKVDKDENNKIFGIGENFTSISFLNKRDLKRLLDTEGTLVDEAKESYLYEIDL